MGGPSETRITEHKRNVKQTEWAAATYNPMDDNDIVLTSTPGDLVQGPCACVHVCACICVVSAGVSLSRRIKMGVPEIQIRTQMSNTIKTNA